MESTAVGQKSDGNIAKGVVAKEITKLRRSLLEIEDLYFSFRDDVETALQDAKYRLDKLAQMIGDSEDVTT